MLGPGGAGVSTIAAAAAVGPVRGGSDGRALLITLDRFRQASRVFGVYSTPGVAVPISQGAALLEIDTLALLGEAWSGLRAPVSLAGGAVTEGLGDIDPEELTGLPGVAELLAWRRIRDEAVSGRWSRIVLDCSGEMDALGFLGIPAMVADYVERLWPRHRRLAGAAENPRLTGGAAVIDALVADCLDIVDLLVDPTCVHAHVVVPTGIHGTEMAHRHVAVLDLMGIVTTEVVRNPGVASAESTADIDTTPPRDGVHVAGVAALPTPPRTVAALRKLGVVVSDAPGLAVGSRAAEVEHLTGTGVTATYRLSWRQPLPDPRSLALGRSGDDLLVTLSGVRHRVSLPSVLRRCTVTDARWEDGMLNIRFQPDPAVWPRTGQGVD
ncbi:hypothetical protein ASG12_12395 [Williamsia sp. Leaf354]|uniref:ArsA family ATPase n=1 Tax=Williamsia sp. Leaf354 TaxID=1736349 RepID=UPI0006FB0BFB|nr:ArsA-related P-loop ATPase [Williamsia sp. Leaf354]KQR97848.1 hypothetical protein ASG12_12395 [Williamsia sp. Leaf354]